MAELQVGGQTVDRDEVRAFATRYLTDGHGWGYPSYDAYDSDHARGPLTDADLLAPVLLSVGRTYNIRLYESLKRRVAELQGMLDRIPQTLRLADAEDDELQLIGELFSVLDGDGVRGARGTVLAKVLHRKRPEFIPLYDRYVDAVYVGNDAACPVPRARGRRTWQEFMYLFARAVRDDLRSGAPYWQSIADLAPTHPITDVRALDIGAWHVGQELVRGLHAVDAHPDDDENEL